jgi:hypothetical protein
VPLLLLFGAAFQSSNSVPGQLQAIQSQLTTVLSQNSALEAKVDSLANKGPRTFYLTKTGHNGADALSACDPRYHMASLREIHDTSNLRYDIARGATTEDSGFGPPNQDGWIRTGHFASTDNVVGIGNCNAWKPALASDAGTLVAPVQNWTATGTTITTWHPTLSACSHFHKQSLVRAGLRRRMPPRPASRWSVSLILFSSTL